MDFVPGSPAKPLSVIDFIEKSVFCIKIASFAIAGGMAAFAGMLATSRVGSVQPGQGTGLELQAIAACVNGGLSLHGGRGSVIGIFLGVLLIHTITNVLLLVPRPASTSRCSSRR